MVMGASNDDIQGETPVVHIAPDIMEEFLDDCLVGEGQPTDDQFKLTFRYMTGYAGSRDYLESL